MPDLDSPPLVLCATPRLARSLRLARGRDMIAAGSTLWPALQLSTPEQWLHETHAAAMLCGNVPPASLPLQPLNALRERMLWERVIRDALAENALQPLFDITGMAAAAMEANRLLLEWDIKLPQTAPTEETRQFLAWRTAFQALCRRRQLLEPVRLMEQRIGLIRAGLFSLPEAVEFAGFDRFSPQLLRLMDALRGQGVAVRCRHPGGTEARAAHAVFDDADAECRAAVAWAAAVLQARPAARLAIVVPELAKLRPTLLRLLDDNLHLQVIQPALAELPRSYDVSLGAPLAACPLVDSALSLLGIALQRHCLPQAEAGRLLRDVYVIDPGEADACARLEARMRQRLPATLSLEQLLRLARKTVLEGWGPQQLAAALEALQSDLQSWRKTRSPSSWSAAFSRTLQAAGWGGRRARSSHEFQAGQAWLESLAEFAALDGLAGNLGAAEALARLSAICRERIFQPEAEGDAGLLVTGMLETLPETLDEIWVMGMNDHVWPPPARPNPLLPAAAQRAAAAPNADATVQAAFAQAVHRRLMQSAHAVRFSSARRDGERALRPSPLLAGMPVADAAGLALSLAERLALPAAMQWLQDQTAPPLAPGEAIRGGSGLLKAQAICPAWAFYQYRLGARALEQPVEGLDALDRGTLLHAVLECFWRGRDSAWLQSLDEKDLQQAVAGAVSQGLRTFAASRDEPLAAGFQALERQRLQRLLRTWIDYERRREPFSVADCEQKVVLEIAGVTVHLSLDRVDRLADGRIVVIDYKTGSRVEHKSWAETRIREPQLPLYAALALAGGEVAAVCFAKVRGDEQKFIGIAADPDLLPDIKGLDEARTLFPEAGFPDWPALLDHWRRSIEAVAREIRDGDAAVRFADEADLRDCEVIPLLRLAERRLQMERGEGGA